MGAGGAESATYTFLFTDIEGSTRRWQAEPEAMRTLLAAHDETLQGAVKAHSGRVFKHTGDGICAVFSTVSEACAAAVESQRKLELPVRMAVHAGEAIERDGDFFGVSLSRCARLMDAGHGGQVLLSASAAGLAGGLELRELGEHRLRDLGEPERIFQVQAPELQREFPALRTLDAVRHNLPVLRSSFVGRELELIEVCERLEDGSVVTLTGIGGCGKTRLALESAARLVDRFPQGVFFAELAVLSDPALLGQAVASALDLQLVDPDLNDLAQYLADRRLLIVLDNCEHLVDACAELVDGLLSRCPALRVLATSRETLGVDGEQVFRVPSLSLETDAVRLFVDRARGVGGDAAAEEVVGEICRRLDGIPLAIELAAARSTHLAPAQILERLSDRFRLLTGGRRRVQRQQTLAAAIDWSHELLSDDEQTLFRRLAVFRGSFTLEAAEQVCHPDAIDLLGSLAGKSLVNVQYEEGVARYGMLETVRMYAEERLQKSGEAIEIRSAHRDWFLGWLESFPVGWLLGWGTGDRLISEADNLTAALEWSLEQDRPDLASRIASRMLGYWWSYARIGELRAWWGVLEDKRSRIPLELHSTVLLLGSLHAMLVGEFEQMEKLSAEALRLASPGSWEAAYAWLIQALWWPYVDPERGKQCIDEGRKAALAAGVPEFERTTAMWSANLLTGDADRDAELGDLLGELLATVHDSPPLSAYITLTIAAAMGDYNEASRLGADVTARTPMERYARDALAVVVAIREGRIDAAFEHLREEVAVVREYAIPLGESSCLTGFAALAAKAGDYERASRHLASIRTAGPFPFRSPADAFVYRQTVRAVRAVLDPDTAARCRAEGTGIPVSQALDAELARPPAQPAARQ